MEMYKRFKIMQKKQGIVKNITTKDAKMIRRLED